MESNMEWDRAYCRNFDSIHELLRKYFFSTKTVDRQTVLCITWNSYDKISSVEMLKLLKGNSEKVSVFIRVIHSRPFSNF